jgi:ATP-dependent Clp protease adaptor protein ClpS
MIERSPDSVARHGHDTGKGDLMVIGQAKHPMPIRGSSEGPGQDDGGGAGLITEAAKPKLKRPPLYKVLLLNDDYTPMEFVVYVLERFFGMGREKATQIMLAVHTRGSAVCGVYPRDVAETKSEQVNQCAQENNHPLLSQVEMAD